MTYRGINWQGKAEEDEGEETDQGTRQEIVFTKLCTEMMTDADEGN